MNCTGYKRAAHDVNRIHGHNLCDSCYLRRYREEHAAAIIKYQKEYQESYRADTAYKTTARLYMRDYRKKPHD